MKKLFYTLLIIFVSGIAFFSFGEKAEAEEGATLYWDINYGGKSISFTSDRSNFEYIGWNDEASSIRISPGWTATLYWDKNYGGESISFTSDNPNFGPIGWNDRASSIRIILQSLISPCNNQIVSLTPTLKWNPVSGAHGYRWQVEDILGNKVASGDIGRYLSSPPTEVTVPAGELELGQPYKWNIRTWDQNGRLSAPSPFCEFITQTTPSVPVTPIGTEPFISSLNPSSGPVRTPLEIRGGNFDLDYSKNIVEFDQTFYVSGGGKKDQVNPISGDASSLKINVPFWLEPGNVAIKVITGGKESNQAIFSVQASASTPSGTTPPGTTPGDGTPSDGGGVITFPNPLGENTTFEILLNKIIDFIFWVGMALAPVMLIIAGLLFVTSAGDPKRVETAKHLALYTIIGLAVILLASGLIKVLESILGVRGT